MAEPAAKRKAPNNLAMERHMVFICPECGQTVDSQLEWRAHLTDVHDYASKKAKDFDFKEIDNKYHECQICLKRLAHAHHSTVVLQYHRFTHLTYGAPYRCRYCSGVYVKKRALSVHLFRCHSQLMNKVDNEYKMDKMRQAIYLRHPRFNREFFMRFICPQCGKIFQRFRDWQEHIDKVHPNTSEKLCMHRMVCSRDYFCDHCSLTMKNDPPWDHLRKHHFSHLPFYLYFQCAYCNTQKSFKTDLFLHFIKHHRTEFLKNKKYICAPEEWAASANEITLKQIQFYTENECPEDPDTGKHFSSNNETEGEPKHVDIEGKEKRTEDETERLSKVIDILPKEDITTQQIQPYTKQNTKGKDILQTALQDSLINLEVEVCSSEIPDHDQQTLENVFVVDMGHKTIGHANSIELNDKELEEICEEMFEEIEDCNHNETEPKKFKSDATQSTNESLKREMQKYINYLCPECLREFNNQTAWRSHVFDEHNLTNAVKLKFRPLNAQKTAYLCLACYQIQRTSKHVDLQRHYFQHMPHQGYLKCMMCMKTKSSKPKMLQHLEFVHRIHIQKAIVAVTPATNAKTLQCLECYLAFEEPLQLQNHILVCPSRLTPLAVTQYDNIDKNRKLLEHLRKASHRIDQMLLEAGIKMT